MKDEGPKVFKLVKTNSALDFLKTNASEGIFFINSKAPCFNYYLKLSNIAFKYIYEINPKAEF